MEWITQSLSLEVLSWPDVFARSGLALLFGLAIGIERDVKHKPVDFRVYMIVAVTTCIIAIMGQELYANYTDADGVLNVDLARIIGGVLTGIGFLGAGAIIKQDNDKVIGTATGASIWASGGMGLCLGFGFYGLGIVLFASVVLVLVVFGYLMRELS